MNTEPTLAPMLSDKDARDGTAYAMALLEKLPKETPEQLEGHLTGVLTVFWAALWGTFGTEYAAGFIEAQLAGMLTERPVDVFNPPARH